MANILVVAAHPDDEVLGCGATMARHAANGDKVFVQFLADGETSRQGATDKDVRAREAAARAAAEALGAEVLSFARLPDNRLDSLPLLQIVAEVESTVRQLRPSIVYTHSYADLNIDHQTTHRAALTACRPLPQKPTLRLLAFEVPSSTEWHVPGNGRAFSPTVFVNAVPFMDAKREALLCYGDEIPEPPHARSMDAVIHLAGRRGAQCGFPAAEAFELIREIQP